MSTIAGIGLVSSLGLDAFTACAAARAGVRRASTSEGFAIRSAVSGAREPVIVHAVPLLTAGFEGEARLLRLLTGALEGLRRSAPALDDPGLVVSAHLALPDPARVLSGVGLLLDDKVRSAREAAIAASPAPPPDDERAISLLQRAAELAGWASTLRLGGVHFGGGAAAIEALCAARDAVNAGRVPVSVAIAADSLLDEDTLAWLNNCGRLKCDAAPAGLQPGEAAVAIALATLALAPSFEAGAPGVFVAGSATSDEPRAFIEGKTSAGAGLSAVVAGARAHAPGETVWIVSDHNGEVYRANELGHAIVRLRASDPGFGAADLWYPALSFGDAGAASPLLGVAVAARALHRNYAPGRAALVAAGSDDGRRACVCVRARN